MQWMSNAANKDPWTLVVFVVRTQHGTCFFAGNNGCLRGMLGVTHMHKQRRGGGGDQNPASMQYVMSKK